MVPVADRRHCFLVKTKNSDWTILIQTVHWIESTDIVMAVYLAGSLSAELKTEAVAVWDDDSSGMTLLLCEKGKKPKRITEGADWSFYQFFYEQGIYLPECFISSDGEGAALEVSDVSEIERADQVMLELPSESAWEQAQELMRAARKGKK